MCMCERGLRWTLIPDRLLSWRAAILSERPCIMEAAGLLDHIVVGHAAWHCSSYLQPHEPLTHSLTWAHSSITSPSPPHYSPCLVDQTQHWGLCAEGRGFESRQQTYIS